MITIKSFVFNPVQENTYVLSDEKDACCIIDPGCYFGNERRVLQEYIEDSGLTPRLLLNTHCHLDHVFGNKFVHDTWGLPLHLHEKEKPVLDLAAAMGMSWGMPFENYRGELVYLREGDTIRLQGKDTGVILTTGDRRDADGKGTETPVDHMDFRILFLPGHSPGHLGFYCEAQRFLIGGDVLFRESIGRTDLPGGDHETLLHSIRTQLWPLPDEVVVYPGHGEPTTIGWEKRHNPFLR